jgi:peptidoglycan/xylan/chitin deacetylase (PgdA/CDA1 family)
MNPTTLLPVLAYHAVGPPLDRRFTPWTVSERLLDEQLAALREAGYQLMSLSAALDLLDASDRTASDQASPATPRLVAVTFDDGYVDFAEAALPRLRQAGAGATLFVVTGYVGTSACWLPFESERRRPLLSWSDLEAVASDGVEIGSHSRRHVELDAVPADVAREEIERSREEIAAHLAAPACFAYPFGYHDASTRRMVARAGYSTACEVGRGLYRSTSDRLRVRRLLVDASTTPEAMLSRCAGPEQLVTARVREAGRPAWRTVRRARRRLRRSAPSGVPEGA